VKGDREDGPRRGSDKRELVLSPGEYAYIQDTTTGTLKTHCGPGVINLAGQLRAIRFDNGNRRFQECQLGQAVKQFAFAPQGDYLVLENPVAKDEEGKLVGPEFPTPAQEKASPTLDSGKKINIPGPCQLALWPQQIATRIEGHNLRSDQYLILRVYDEILANANWDQAIAKTTENIGDEDSDEISVVSQDANDLDLTVGKLFIIKGTNVSFFIPPTGVEVVPESTASNSGNFVRDALTLEMSEYCILVNQNGNKRYERGPEVVFPEPTENFYTENDSNKFRPIELNHLQGLHIKVNCNYIDNAWPDASGGVEVRNFKEGEELFLTGTTHSIYYPREEHSIVRYGENLIHYATCIPEGEARYVMDRNTGVIEKRLGPDMMLLNPITEVMVRRILSDSESNLMYPGNATSLDYNRQLRAMMGQSKSSRSGFVSEGDYLSNVGEGLESFGAEAASSVGTRGQTMSASLAYAPQRKALGHGLPDEITRGTEYTKPRTITLDTKFDGVPKLIIWTGYAVLVVKANGDRRVEVGPKAILLDYDETVEPLHLSTGKPKTTDTLVSTGYLRVVNNKVSDIIALESSDNIPVNVKVSYRVNFEATPEHWFSVENYVKFLCDHARSKLKGTVKKLDIETFYGNAVSVIRDTLLGSHDEENEERPGLAFNENGMRVNDVEVLDVTIQNRHIADLLVNAQHETIQNNIEMERARKQLDVVRKKEEVKQATADAEFQTIQKLGNIEIDKIALTLRSALENIAAQSQQLTEKEKVAVMEENIENIAHNAQIERERADDALTTARTQAETAAMVTRLEAAQGGLSEALLALQDAQTLEKVAEALGPMRFIGGENVVDAIRGVFAGTPLEGIAAKLSETVSHRGRERRVLETTETTSD